MIGMMKPLDEQIKSKLDEHLSAIGNRLNADVIAILSPILPGLDVRLRAAIDAVPNKRSTVALILDTRLCPICSVNSEAT